jgi:hypothetical protein
MTTRNKHGTMEMSIGTIVTIVLLVSVLILGIFLIQKIFKSATSVVDLTDQQLRSEVNKLFSGEEQIAIYPSTRLVEIKQNTEDGVGVGIRNLQTGASASTTFSYSVQVSDPNIQTKCGIPASDALAWIQTGQAENNIPIPSGDFSSQKVLFQIPVGAPLCIIRFRVTVTPDKGSAFSDFFDLSVKAK